ncbi:MAG: hypothetical protein ACERKF_21670, partial [Vibrio cyclitrophicus]
HRAPALNAMPAHIRKPSLTTRLSSFTTYEFEYSFPSSVEVLFADHDLSLVNLSECLRTAYLLLS